MRYDFNFSQDILVEYTGTVVGHLANDLPDFTAFDPDLNQAKVDEMDAHIDWFLTEGGDEASRGTLAERTAAVIAELNSSRRIYNQVRYWVMKAFRMHKPIQRQFGIGRISKIADNQSEMVVFMGSLSQQVEAHRIELEAAGAPGAVLDEVAVRAEALRIANEAQEMMKGHRTVDTSVRIAKLNVLFEHTRDFNTAAEFVYYDDSAKRDLYRPPSNTDTAEALEEEEAEA